MSVDACKAAIKLVHQHTVSNKMTIPCTTISAKAISILLGTEPASHCSPMISASS